MKIIKLMRRALLSTAIALLAANAHATTTTYFLQYMTLETGNAPGQTFFFGTPYLAGSGSLGSSQCIGCVTDTTLISGTTGMAVLTNLTGDVAITNLNWSLRSFGANFLNQSNGDTTLGASTDYIKSFGSCTLYSGTATQYCSPTDVRTYAGNWYDGLAPDGVTASNNSKFSASANANFLTLVLRKPLLVTDPAVTNSWLQLTYNFAVVPVPAAVWLFGGALGVLGFARRRKLAT